MRIKHGLKFSLILCMGTLFAQAEPSVYGFGADPEMMVIDIKPTTSLRTMADMRRKILEQDERIEGLTTIIEGLSTSLNELNMGSASSRDDNSDALLQKLSDMIDDINAKYVSKDELQAALGKKSTVKSTPVSPNNIAKKDTLNSKNKVALYSEGVRHFMKKRYAEAKQRFEMTDKKGYKPAASNYYLGEISYYSKKYKDAIFYFKKSAGLNDKASYIDTLLLHTAVSLEKIGDKGQAKAFYENIIENYQGKKTASISKKRLQNL